MQRFRLMNLYVVGVIVLVLLTLGGVAWLRRPGAPARPHIEQAATAVAATAPVSDAGPASADAARPVTVSIDNFTFTPRTVTVAVGATVTWVNHDDVPHTATSDDEPARFDSKALDSDEKYSFTFTKPGTYRYFCKVHTHMTGTVIVE